MFFDRLRERHVRSVVQKVWTLLHAILEDAVDDELIGKIPMRRVPRPKTKLPRKPVLDRKLLPKVLKAVQHSPRDSAILHIGAFCAMRPAEVFGLRWSSFCGDHFVIRDSAWEGKLPADTPISTHNYRNRVLVPLAEKLELTVPLTFQVLRRSHATRNQRTPKDTQAHLGHRSIVTTMNVYTQEIPASVMRVVERDERQTLNWTLSLHSQPESGKSQ
jgi:integrase